jgi:hypothetical protein
VNQITLLMSGRFTFTLFSPRSIPMLFLAAIVQLAPSSEPQSDDLLAQSRVGHVGLTVITLVYVFVTLWQQ